MNKIFRSFFHLTILSMVLLMLFPSCQKSRNQGSITLIPKPETIIEGKGCLRIHGDLNVRFSDESLRPVFNTFKDQLEGKINALQTENGKSQLEIVMDSVPEIKDESYSLDVGRRSITIRGKSPRGIYYGLQTLRQMILFAKEDNKICIPRCSITDSPRYAWRGVMVDESRHFFGKGKILQMLDIMSLHKLNVFHWHLTDSPGWRIEIKKYPKLTEIGSIGNHTNPVAPASFYTQDEIREIVKFASDRFIDIIPEIDMPGHATAANRSYPEYSGGGSERYPDFTFNPGKEGTYQFLTDIIRELTGLFPSQYFHIGGDEVSFGNQQWPDLPDVKKLMRKERINDLKAVETYFNRRISDSVVKMGKTVVGWDEIVDAKLDPDISVSMWWRHDKQDQLLKAFENGYSVVLCPRIPLYFDFVQHETHQDGRKWRNTFCSLESVYHFPPETLAGYPEYENQVKGIQANLWAERIHNSERFDFMLYPRISALAEAAWTRKENKSYPEFTESLKPMLSYFASLNIRYFNPFNPESTPEPAPAVRTEK